MIGRMPVSSRTGDASGLKGTGYKSASIQQFTPEQQELFSQLFSQVSPQSFTSRLAGGDQSAFGELEAPALKQFGELQGSIANRFSGAGMGARRSSGFNQAQTTAAQDFAQQLQAQRLGLRRQAMQDLMSNSQMLLGQRPQENFLIPEKTPWWQSLLLSANDTGRDIAKSYFGGQF